MRGVVCYHCQRKGHMLRSCPRKSAGLPKVRADAANQGNAMKKWVKPLCPGGPSKGKNGTRPKQFKKPFKRVYNVDGNE